MFEWIADPNIWASLLTLTFLEIVLGIDNIIFLSIITDRVAENRRVLAQRLGAASSQQPRQSQKMANGPTTRNIRRSSSVVWYRGPSSLPTWTTPTSTPFSIKGYDSKRK